MLKNLVFPCLTMDVKEYLEVPYHALMDMIREKKLPPISKDRSGNYKWEQHHVEAASAIIAVRKARKEARQK